MTIKEIEQHTGLTRANIRFYELEGLLEISRTENGYRDYTQENLDTINKIKLLRILNVGIEQIKSIIVGDNNLSDVLQNQLENLENEAVELDISKDICDKIASEGVSFDNLDCKYYLEIIKTKKEQAHISHMNTDRKIAKTDIKPQIIAPWRRYFARTIDFIIYRTIINAILMLVFDVNMEVSSNVINIACTILGMMTMIFIEPLLISKFGTTIGKRTLGIYIYKYNGDKATYKEIFIRTVYLMWSGMGFNIPIYSIIRLYKCFELCNFGEILPWQGDETIEYKKCGLKNYIVGLMITILSISSMILIQNYQEMPKNRGDITISEFSENYNRFIDYNGNFSYYKLDKYGIIQTENSLNYVYITEAENSFKYTTDTNGYITAVSFTSEATNASMISSDFAQDKIYLMAQSFIGAQDDCGLFSDYLDIMVSSLSQNAFQDFEIKLHGITMTVDVEKHGFENTVYSGYIFKSEDVDSYYSVTVTMQK